MPLPTPATDANTQPQKRKSPVDGDDEETPKKASKPRTPRAKKVKTEEVETEEAAAEDVKEEE